MKDHILIVILIYISIVILIYNSTFLYYMCIDHISYTDSATRTYVQDGTCTSLGFHGDYDEPGMRIQTVSRQLLFHCMDTHFLIPCVSLSIVWWCYSHLLAGFIFFHDVSGNSNDIWLLSPFFSIHFWHSPFFSIHFWYSSMGESLYFHRWESQGAAVATPTATSSGCGPMFLGSWALQNCVKNRAKNGNWHQLEQYFGMF